MRFQIGLLVAIEFVERHGVGVVDLPEGQTKLIIGNEAVFCFQLYPDIDLFYYES
jgi:hypothetical protein